MSYQENCGRCGDSCEARTLVYIDVYDLEICPVCINHVIDDLIGKLEQIKSIADCTEMI